MAADFGTLEHYFGVSSDELQAQTLASPEAPKPRQFAGPSPVGSPGTVASFTDWRRSPVFWLAVFAVFALGMIHLEGAVRARVG